MSKKLVAKKFRKDSVAKGFTLGFLVLFLILFIGVIAFIIYGSVPGWQQYGFMNIFGTDIYNLEIGKASAWLPVCVTLMITLLALLIGGPVGIKTATFIKFRIPQRYQKAVRMFIEFLSNIPSVVFGLFTISIFGPVITTIFHLPSNYNLVNTGIMLAFMIMPTVVSLNLSALDSVDPTFISSPMLLGNTKTGAIYKVYKKQIRGKVVISLITGVSRALGETMAVSMILSSQAYNQVFNSGFIGVWTSYLKPLGGLISSNMFAEITSEGLKGLLFVYGLFLFIVVLILNAVTKVVFRQKPNTKRNPITQGIVTVVCFIPRCIKKLWNKILNKDVVVLNPENVNNNLARYYQQRAFKSKLNGNVYAGWKLFWEAFCSLLLFAFIVWIFFDIIINGAIGWQAPSCTVFQFGKNTTGQAFVNTLLIIIVGVGIGFVIALFTAIFLNEFAKDGKVKTGILFFMDSLGATPSIIYGMFGLVFFIQVCGMTSAGPSGRSIIAGALTIVFVILPAFTRTILQALQTTSKEVRQASYALGIGKWETTRKIVLPAATQHILTAIVLSIGRVFAETAPLYLTAGLGGGSKISFLTGGQTLTTRIYAQLNSNNIVQAKNIMYECALLNLILILIILAIVDIVIPQYFKHKKKKASMSMLDYKEKKAYKKQKRIDQARHLFNSAKLYYNWNLRS